jgi:hypothetical protein
MPMRRRSLFMRIALTAVAIVQMAVPVFAAVADARLVADSGGAPIVHIEEHTQKGCRPVHPDDCVLCQLLTHFSAPRSSGPAVPASTASRSAASVDVSYTLSSIFRAHERTRAPPVSLS